MFALEWSCGFRNSGEVIGVEIIQSSCERGRWRNHSKKREFDRYKVKVDRTIGF